jgi:hypothetical protein
MKGVLIAVASVVGLIVVLAAGDFFLLWQPSLQGNCNKPEHHSISTLHGQVVGKSLTFVQYRWLRRRFKAVGTTLSLDWNLPSTVALQIAGRKALRTYDTALLSRGSQVRALPGAPTFSESFEKSRPRLPSQPVTPLLRPSISAWQGRSRGRPCGRTFAWQVAQQSRRRRFRRLSAPP